MLLENFGGLEGGTTLSRMTALLTFIKDTILPWLEMIFISDDKIY